jgi:hypothetical protein
MLAGIVAVVFFCISFFTFLGINKAFHDDGACGPDVPGENKKDYCHKFIGKSGNEKWNGGMGHVVEREEEREKIKEREEKGGE